MHLAVLSDVYANLPALEAVLADVDRAAPAGIWVSGDLVGYNPWPNEVLQILRDRRMQARPRAPPPLADARLLPAGPRGDPGVGGPAGGLGPGGRRGPPRPAPPHLRDPPRAVRHRRGRDRDQAERPSHGTRGSPLHRRVM